jgi:ankyrin repeat protein
MMRAEPGAALIAAVKKKALFMVKMVCEEYGADMNVVDGEGNGALHWAAWFERPEIVDYLCSRDVPPNADLGNKKGQTPLHWAAMSGVIGCIKPLLRLGGDLTLTDKDGFGVAHCAAQVMSCTSCTSCLLPLASWLLALASLSCL